MLFETLSRQHSLYPLFSNKQSRRMHWKTKCGQEHSTAISGKVYVFWHHLTSLHRDTKCSAGTRSSRGHCFQTFSTLVAQKSESSPICVFSVKQVSICLDLIFLLKHDDFQIGMFPESMMKFQGVSNGQHLTNCRIPDRFFVHVTFHRPG